MKAAAIGIGSNSVRMLLIETEGASFRRLLRDREGTRLFAGLDENGNLSQSAMDTTIAAVARMAKEAREQGAQAVHLFATSATRDAANQAEFTARLQQEAQLEMEICSGYREAQLSFLGATDGGYSGVIDIGGGSTELTVGQGTHLVCAFSCQMGAVRLFRQAPITGHGDLPAVEQLATDILDQKLTHHPTLNIPDRWIGTGGTFTTLSAMVKGIRWSDRTYMHGTRLTLEQVERQALLLSDMPMEERLQLPGLQPHRADIVVHGICILSATMKRLGIREITVSEYGNLDGYLKEKYSLREAE
ncbi:MAG: hypothetical protein E7316_05740 [Clostridiales bacterium]|nr:hypothetical protein [Clostridiales bacterium]